MHLLREVDDGRALPFAHLLLLQVRALDGIRLARNAARRGTGREEGGVVQLHESPLVTEVAGLEIGGSAVLAIVGKLLQHELLGLGGQQERGRVVLDHLDLSRHLGSGACQKLDVLTSGHEGRSASVGPTWCPAPPSAPHGYGISVRAVPMGACGAHGCQLHAGGWAPWKLSPSARWSRR